MGIVTGHAAVILDYSVKLALLRGIIVTVSAQGWRLLDEKAVVLRGMRVVTIGASASRGSLVKDLTGHNIIVTLQTEVFRGFDQKSLVERTVRIMANQAAVFLDNGVHLFLIAGNIVAFGAKLRRILNQKAFVLRGVGIVAVYTTAFGRRFMENRPRHHVIVALHTEFVRGICQQVSVSRTMRVVAGQAAVLLDNGVHISIFSRVVVTLKAKGRTLFDKDQLLIITMMVVTGGAIILIDGRMKDLH